MASVYALLCAIDNYPNPKHILQGCVRDMQHLQGYLEYHCQQENLTLHLNVLSDEEVSRQALIAAFDHFQEAKSGDQCLFFFGGHGSRCPAPEAFWHLKPDQKLESLVCWDSRNEGGRDLMDKELSWLIWRAVEGKDIPFISITDCCHSGRLRDTANEVVRTRDIPTLGANAKLEQYLGYADYHKSAEGQLSPPQGRRVHLAAARELELAKEINLKGVPQGVFTYYLVETLYQSGRHQSYESILNQVNLRVRRMVGEQSPQLDTAKVEDKKLGFLSLQPASESAPYVVIRDQAKVWWLNAGAMHGIQVGEPGNRTQLVLAKDQHIVEVVETEAQRAKLFGMDGYDPSFTYTAYLKRLASANFSFGVANGSDPLGIAALEAQLQKTKGNLFRISPESAGPFLLHAREGALFLSRVGDYTPIFNSTSSYEEKAVSTFLKKLNRIANWQWLQDLQNPASEIQEDEISLEMRRMIVPNDLSNDAPHEWVDWRALPVLLPYLEENGQLYHPGFRLSIKNTSFRPLWLSLLYLGKNFGVSNVLLPKQYLAVNETIEIGYLHAGQIKNVIPLQLETYLQKMGIDSIEECLKLILSTEELNTDLWNQEGILPDENKPLPALRDTVDRYEVEQKDWRTLEIWLQISMKKD